MSVQHLVQQLNEAVTQLPGVQDVKLPDLNNPFEFYGGLIRDSIPKSKLTDEGKQVLVQLAEYFELLGSNVLELDEADRFESRSSLELIGIARLALDHPRLKQLIGTLLFVDELLDAHEARARQQGAGA